MSGQLSIRWAERSINRSMNSIMGNEESVDYVVAIDTDSIYVEMEDLVKAVNPKNPVEFIDKACVQKFEPLLAEAYGDLFTHMNAHENRMEMSREVIADKAVWTGKKHYIVNVHNNEGVQYAQPKVKIKGLEAVKSSTPRIVRDKFMKAYEIILRGTEDDLQKFVADFYDEFIKLPVQDVSFPRGVSDIAKWEDSVTMYKSGCPIHVRGSLVFNSMLQKHGLEDSMDVIKNGTKIKFCYLEVPNTAMSNVIAFPQFLPKEMQLESSVDYKTQFEKTFKKPLAIIADAVDWNLEKTATLEAFFE